MNTKEQLAEKIYNEYYERQEGDEFFFAEKVREIVNWLDDESVNDRYESVYLDWCEYCDIMYNDELEYEQSLEECDFEDDMVLINYEDVQVGEEELEDFEEFEYELEEDGD